MDEAALLHRIAELERRLEWLYRATGYGSAYPGVDLGACAGSPHAPYDPATGPSEGVQDLVRRGLKIQAIKLYREQTGVSLKEARDTVKRMR